MQLEPRISPSAIIMIDAAPVNLLPPIEVSIEESILPTDLGIIEPTNFNPIYPPFPGFEGFPTIDELDADLSPIYIPDEIVEPDDNPFLP